MTSSKPAPRSRISSAAGRRAIFITGAASGIGRATAERFAGHGWFVGVFDIDEAGARTVAATLGDGNACAGRLDVSKPSDWQAALADFWSQSGQRLDVLLNNAGILASGRFEAIPLARHAAMLDVNILGMITGCHSAFDYLNKTPGAQVINMASATAIYGQPELATYSATKFAVRGFTEALDLEWTPLGVRVSDIWPTFVKTAMADEYGRIASAKSLGIRLRPADVATAVWEAVTKPSVFRSPHRTVGVQAAALALATRWGPAALTRWVVQRLSMTATPSG